MLLETQIPPNPQKQTLPSAKSTHKFTVPKERTDSCKSGQVMWPNHRWKLWGASAAFPHEIPNRSVTVELCPLTEDQGRRSTTYVLTHQELTLGIHHSLLTTPPNPGNQGGEQVKNYPTTEQATGPLGPCFILPSSVLEQWSICSQEQEEVPAMQPSLLEQAPRKVLTVRKTRNTMESRVS